MVMLMSELAADYENQEFDDRGSFMGIVGRTCVRRRSKTLYPIDSSGGRRPDRF